MARHPISSALQSLGRRLADGAAETLWPTRCLGCERPGVLLCPDCAAALPAIDQAHACPRCGAPFGSLVCTECTDCLGHPDDDRGEKPPEPRDLADPLALLDGACCYGLHEWPLDRIVRGYKDAGERRASVLLAALIAQAVGDAGEACGSGAFSAPFDGVTFVPCTPDAYARRGFDHMEEVARHAAALLGLPFVDALARWAPRDQRGLTKGQRAENARASLVPVVDVAGTRLLLLDDVLTTGATLGAAAGALKLAGARRVAGATVARAW